MKIKPAGILILTALIFSGSAYAHHSFFAVFDGDRTVTVKGTVTEFRMVNPHAMMYLDTKDSSGNVQTWSVEFDGRLHLSRARWNRETFKVGQVLEVTGNPARSDSPAMFFNHSVDTNGVKIRRPRLDLNDSIEEQRRQRRALQETSN